MMSDNCILQILKVTLYVNDLLSQTSDYEKFVSTYNMLFRIHTKKYKRSDEISKKK